MLPEGVDPFDPFVALFSESAGSAVVAGAALGGAALHRMCEARGLPWVRIGVVDTDEQDALTVPLTEPARRL